MLNNKGAFLLVGVGYFYLCRNVKSAIGILKFSITACNIRYLPNRLFTLLNIAEFRQKISLIPSMYSALPKYFCSQQTFVQQNLKDDSHA